MKQILIPLLLLIAVMSSCQSTTTPDEEMHLIGEVTNDSIYSKEFIPEHMSKGVLIPDEYIIHTYRNNMPYNMVTGKETYDFYNVGDIIDKNFNH